MANLQNKHFSGVLALLRKLETQEMRDNPDAELSIDAECEGFRAARGILDQISGETATDTDPVLDPTEARLKGGTFKQTGEVARGDKKRARDSRPRFANDASRRATDHALVRASDGRNISPSSPFSGIGSYEPGHVDPTYSIDSIFKR
jgi:hypothetical protein